MDDGGSPPTSSMVGSIDNEFMDQLFDSGCWLQTAEGSRFFQPSVSASDAMSFQLPYNIPSQGSNSTNLITAAPQQDTHQQEFRRYESGSSSTSHAPQKAENALVPTYIQKGIIQSVPQNLSLEGSVLNSIWIAPKENSGPSSSVKERLMSAISNYLSLTRDRSVLIQIWVPVTKGVKNYLTTLEQPYLYDQTSLSLANYRNVSEAYEFSADEDSKEGVGLPGRVFLGKAAEWTPDVRFFRQDEYPRVSHAQMCDVRGSIALPVFEKESRNCLGVVEIVTTSQKVSYRPEVESVCKALEAVNLRSSEILSPYKEMGGNEPHSVELSELLHILRTVCDRHGLPLGQTWAPCTQASKCRNWNSDVNMHCASTVDVACYVRDQQVAGFHEACSEQHLLRGQGVVGKAFATNEPCYAIDVTAYSKAEYPLSHHAKMFGLRGAVAIHLQCLYGACRSYVLGFFLPIGCQDPGLTFHCKIMESLTMMVHGSRNLCFLSSKKILQERKDDSPRLESSLSKKSNHTETSWISEMVEAGRKGKEVDISFGKEQTDHQYKAESQGGRVNINQEFNTSPVEGLAGSSAGSGNPLVTRKAVEKKTKIQKTISLQVLKQHFAGNLKDAAKSLGVCPTTLKRICRQHGINRWPSRKIKKVGHSLKKLQLVMDSVQGAQGSIQLSSFYSSFPQLNSPTETETEDQSKQANTLPERPMFNSGGTTSHSTSSSQTSSSSHSFSTGAKASPITGDTSTSKIARSEPELQLPNNMSPTSLQRSQSDRTLGGHPKVEHLPPLPSNRNSAQKDRTVCKVKATFGEEMIRFTLTSNMSLADLKCEIAKRFRIDVHTMQIKYLDDDREWVLLTCDDDLEECVDIHKSYERKTIKLSVHQATTRFRRSLGSTTTALS